MRRHDWLTRRIRPVTVGMIALLGAGCGERAPLTVRLAVAPDLAELGAAQALVEAFHATHPQVTVTLLPAGTDPFAQARNGEADVLLTDAPTEEARLVAEGIAAERVAVLHSEYVLLGPPEDPADVAGLQDIGEAFAAIAATGMRYVKRSVNGVTRPDDGVWATLGVAPSAASRIDAGPGMAEALRLASEQRAYILSDLATFFRLAPSLELEIVSQGDARLVRPFAAVRITNAATERAARIFVEWLAGADARAAIESVATDPFGAPVLRAGAVPLGPR